MARAERYAPVAREVNGVIFHDDAGGVFISRAKGRLELSPRHFRARVHGMAGLFSLPQAELHVAA